MAYIPLAPFDRERDFVAQRDFTLHGVNLKKGDPIDKTTCSTRTLRLVFEARAIGYPEHQGPRPMRVARFAVQREPGAPRPAPTPPAPTEPTKPALNIATDDNAPLGTDEERLAFELGHTKPQLIAIAKGHGITIGRGWSKTVLVAEIARARYGTS